MTSSDCHNSPQMVIASFGQFFKFVSHWLPVRRTAGTIKFREEEAEENVVMKVYGLVIEVTT
jgi:hypothetical protein